MTARPSLVDFAATSKASRPPKCWMCRIPEREEVEDAILSGHVMRTTAANWLADECGYGTEATGCKVQHHMLHHVKRPA